MKKQRINWKARALIAESKVESFFTGDIPDNATLDHMVMAKYGRKRHADLAKIPALLVSPTTN